MVKVQEIINKTYKYFNRSQKNMAMLESEQSLSGGSSSRFKEVFHIRWLSYRGSVDGFVSHFGIVVSVFLQENSGKSISLHKPISSFNIVYVSHFLCVVLKPPSVLSNCTNRQIWIFPRLRPIFLVQFPSWKN